LIKIEKKHNNVRDIKQKVVFLRKIMNIIKMKRVLLPKQEKMLRVMGENIHLARLRRDLSSEQVAERAGISRNTLIKIEKGDEGVAIGMYFRVLIVLGLQDDLLLIARDDVLGRKLQDIGLTTPRRATKRPPLNN
jgi:DNA-binding XRE family transcriptional regulator